MIPLLFPLLAPTIIATLLCLWPEARQAANPFLPIAPWLVLLSGLLLAWRFNRSRLTYSLLLLLVAGATLQWSQTTTFDVVAYNWTVILVPGCLALLILLPDRGFLSPSGLLRPAMILALIGAACATSALAPENVANLFRLTFLPDFFPRGPRPADLHVINWFFWLSIAAWWTWRNPAPIEAGLLAAMFFSIPALHFHGPLEQNTWWALAGLAPTLAIIEMSHLMAFRDDLTGLPGRRALNEALQRLGSNYTIAMLDIDHFKKFNDRHGHDVGDQVLRMVAAQIAKAKGGGKAFRYGGEEFSIIFPGQSLKESLSCLEAVRTSVESASFTTRRRLQRPKNKPTAPKPADKKNQSLKVTISIGAAERLKPMSPEQVIKAADKALYKAKKAGRNRVSS